MARIKEKIKPRKFFKLKEGVSKADLDAEGDITISKEKMEELSSESNMLEAFNDPVIFHILKPILGQLEDMRVEVEELHAFIINAFGEDSANAASAGSKGDKGSAGSKGNSHLENVEAIRFDRKINKLVVVIKDYEYKLDIAKNEEEGKKEEEGPKFEGKK